MCDFITISPIVTYRRRFEKISEDGLENFISVKKGVRAEEDMATQENRVKAKIRKKYKEQEAFALIE
jgi:hypothetical protein